MRPLLNRHGGVYGGLNSVMNMPVDCIPACGHVVCRGCACLVLQCPWCGDDLSWCAEREDGMWKVTDIDTWLTSTRGTEMERLQTLMKADILELKAKLMRFDVVSASGFGDIIRATCKRQRDDGVDDDRVTKFTHVSTD